MQEISAQKYRSSRKRRRRYIWGPGDKGGSPPLTKHPSPNPSVGQFPFDLLQLGAEMKVGNTPHPHTAPRHGAPEGTGPSTPGSILRELGGRSGRWEAEPRPAGWPCLGCKASGCLAWAWDLCAHPSPRWRPPGAGLSPTSISIHRGRRGTEGQLGRKEKGVSLGAEDSSAPVCLAPLARPATRGFR